MADTKDDLKNKLQKKSLSEIEALLFEYRGKIGKEKNLTILHRLTSELNLIKEIHEQKLKESGRLFKTVKQTAKPTLKSFEDYEKSKK